MADYTLPYGKTALPFRLPDAIRAEMITPPHAPAAAQPRALVRAALAQPLGDIARADFAAARRVAIAINDKTRPVPHQHLLPPLFDWLRALGVADAAVTLLIASGAHPPMTAAEFAQVVPDDIRGRCRLLSHDCDDDANLVDGGVTARGTPVLINRIIAEADLRIVVGNIEPHQFQGFSGGVKSAAIGLAGRETINRNHALMTEPLARLGEYDRNPARQDVEEIGERMGVHFALNAILNHEKKIVQVLAGAPRAVMEAGIPLARRICQVPVTEPFDLLLVSPGGHPKDINVYQAQKALAHAALITRPGGAILLAAACPEGTGSKSYETWVVQRHSLQAVLDDFAAQPFQVGPHKAYQIARDAARFRVRLVSDMADVRVRRLLLTPAANIDAALAELLPALPAPARVGLMPAANATIPRLQTN